MTDPFPWETTPALSDDPEHGASYPGEVIRGHSLEIARRLERAHVANALDGLSGDSGALAAFTRRTRDLVVEVVAARAQERKAGRPDVVTDRSDLRPELIGAADDAEVLDRLAAVFVDGAKIAKGIAGDLLTELPPRADGKPVRTMRTGDGQGFELKVTTSPKSEAFADLDAIVDVVRADVVGRFAPEVNDLAPVVIAHSAHSRGVREGIAAILEVLGSPKVKTTALDELALQLEGRGEADLAKRLRAAYGRREVGEPSVKIERTPLYADDPSSSDEAKS